MTDLAAWIAEKRAVVNRSHENPGDWRAGGAFDEMFDTRLASRLLDAVEALDMLRRESKAYGGTSPAAEAAADAALDALGGGGE